MDNSKEKGTLVTVKGWLPEYMTEEDAYASLDLNMKQIHDPEYIESRLMGKLHHTFYECLSRTKCKEPHLVILQAIV